MSDISLRGIIDEDFVNYRVPSMTLIFPYCSFKCGKDLCQNTDLAKQKIIHSDVDYLCKRYLGNPISEAIVCQGLEPMDSFPELMDFIDKLRLHYKCNDDIVIYTGYNREEIKDQITTLSQFKNIIVKFGRFVPGDEPHMDGCLGVKLASDNQYAVRL